MAATTGTVGMRHAVESYLRYRELTFMYRVLMNELIESEGKPNDWTIDEMEEVLIELIAMKGKC